jgi:hypothetical protein
LQQANVIVYREDFVRKLRIEKMYGGEVEAAAAATSLY